MLLRHLIAYGIVAVLALAIIAALLRARLRRRKGAEIQHIDLFRRP